MSDVACIRDDSTECDCPRCLAAEDAFWDEQEGDVDDDQDEDLDVGACPGCGASTESSCICWQDDVDGPAVQR